MHGRGGGPWGEVLERIEGRWQEGIIADVGRRRDRSQRNAAPLGQLRALHAALAPVDRAASGALAAARGLGGAAVHREVGQIQADHLVVASRQASRSRSTRPAGSTRRDAGAAWWP